MKNDSPSDPETADDENASGLRMRTPRAEDASLMWTMLERIGGLERNTLYAYLLVCTHFAETSVIAETTDGRPAGFVASYRPPTHTDAVFVWQVGVDPEMRGRGVGRALLEGVCAQPGCDGVRWLEATVTPSNEASDRLFRGFARARGVECEVRPHFTVEHFAPLDHEPEHLYRIGPLR